MLLRRPWTAETPYLYDLVEPCLRVEVPVWVHESDAWQQLVNACSDVTAWCNDVASRPKERGDVHNFVVLAMRQLGLSEREATDWVLDRIAGRCLDISISGAIGPEVLMPRREIHIALSGLFSAAVAAVGS